YVSNTLVLLGSLKLYGNEDFFRGRRRRRRRWPFRGFFAASGSRAHPRRAGPGAGTRAKRTSVGRTGAVAVWRAFRSRIRLSTARGSKARRHRCGRLVKRGHPLAPARRRLPASFGRVYFLQVDTIRPLVGFFGGVVDRRAFAAVFAGTVVRYQRAFAVRFHVAGGASVMVTAFRCHFYSRIAAILGGGFFAWAVFATVLGFDGFFGRATSSAVTGSVPVIGMGFSNLRTEITIGIIV
ncbi:hypothetical protein U1Q18_050951, partial [Sarracenia purpurea var. burkii]